ncbi:MAG TPA: hypothetical protein DIT13_17230 [Verrucomicrobiales bacterium]|nr:hypothetical protein [Verrucomicrobiales bacterium]
MAHVFEDLASHASGERYAFVCQSTNSFSDFFIAQVGQGFILVIANMSNKHGDAFSRQLVGSGF